jgi:hypothetical protein
VKKNRARIHKILLQNNQVRVIVPFADWQIYQTARKHGLPYKEAMLRHGRKFMKRTA